MLLDTSGLLCLLHRDERQHADASRLYTGAKECLTQSYVLAEFVALCHVRGLRRENVIGFLSSLIEAPRVKVEWVDESLHRRAMALLEARLDKSYSLCDAVSFVLMHDRGIQEALTTDKHFEQEGFIRLLPGQTRT